MLTRTLAALAVAAFACASPVHAATIQFDPAKVASLAADKFTPAPSVGLTGGAAPVLIAAAAGTQAVPVPVNVRSYAALPIVGLMGAMLIACVIAFTAARASSRAAAK